jgi:hypothetical protein
MAIVWHGTLRVRPAVFSAAGPSIYRSTNIAKEEIIQMSHMGPPPPYFNRDPGNEEYYAQDYFSSHGMPQYQQDMYARQPGGLAAEYQRRAEAEAQHILNPYHRLYGSASSSVGSARSNRVWPYRPPEPRYQPSVTPPRISPAARPTKSRAGLVVAVCLVVLVIVAVVSVADYLHGTKTVTLEEMGIQDKTYATWSQDLNSLVFKDVTFNINTTNSSDEDRKVKFCARKEPGMKDICLTHRVKAHSTVKGPVSKSYLYDADEQNTNGPDQKVVKVDGFKVRA